MSRKAVQQVIGQAVTDSKFRAKLFADPDSVLAGFDLTPEERDALRAIPAENLEELANNLDTRISMMLVSAALGGIAGLVEPGATGGLAAQEPGATGGLAAQEPGATGGLAAQEPGATGGLAAHEPGATGGLTAQEPGATGGLAAQERGATGGAGAMEWGITSAGHAQEAGAGGAGLLEPGTGADWAARLLEIILGRGPVGGVH